MFSRIFRGQKGAFLVLTAILVPVIFLFTCLAADLGKGWAYQSKLQNGTDAAVLAGAYVYKVNQDQGNTRTRMEEYMNSNMGRDGYKIDRIRYRYKEGGSYQRDPYFPLCQRRGSYQLYPYHRPGFHACVRGFHSKGHSR